MWDVRKTGKGMSETGIKVRGRKSSVGGQVDRRQRTNDRIADFELRTWDVGCEG